MSKPTLYYLGTLWRGAEWDRVHWDGDTLVAVNDGCRSHLRAAIPDAPAGLATLDTALAAFRALGVDGARADVSPVWG